MPERTIQVELIGGPSDGMRCELLEELNPYELLTYVSKGFGQQPWEAHYERVSATRYEYRGQT